MRILLIAALLSSAVFETHHLVGQTSAALEGRSSDNATLSVPVETDVADESKPALRFNLATKTAGGTQIWTDHVYRSGCRIQENSLTGHYRLLDSNNVRQAWGTQVQCQAAMDQTVPVPQPGTTPRHVVVLLHGLMRTSHSMKALGESLQETSSQENGVDEVIRFQYASTRRSIDDHAKALQRILESQPTDAQFSFAGHSMGNIVVRRMIGELEASGDPAKILPRCRAMVMLGPPNQGASISRRLAPTGLYGIVTGKGGMELGPQWSEFVKKLATPPFPFAIVAGDVSNNRIQNPLVDGDGDFVVSLEEAKLDGCEEFYTVDVLHSFLMSDPRAVKLTVDFLTSH